MSWMGDVHAGLWVVSREVGPVNLAVLVRKLLSKLGGFHHRFWVLKRDFIVVGRGDESRFAPSLQPPDFQNLLHKPVMNNVCASHVVSQISRKGAQLQQ